MKKRDIVLIFDQNVDGGHTLEAFLTSTLIYVLGQT